MTRTIRIALALGTAAAITACSVRDDAANQTAVADPATTETTTSVTRQEIAAPTPTPTQALPAAIQTQPGPDGATVALNRAHVTGDVLTVALTYSGGKCCSSPPINDVSVIDDATAQRLGVLKDNAGRPMAAPINSSGSNLSVTSSNDSPLQVWLKFPAPPPTTKTVSITLPEVAPFDAVPVTR